MILDIFENARLYEGALPGISRLTAFALSLRDAPAGRYDFEGGGHYVLIQTPVTRARLGAPFEAHRRYADVQLLLEGDEVLRWAPLASLAITVPYDEHNDALIAEGEGVDIPIRPGTFYALFPGDAHAPLCAPADPGVALKKAVVKLLLPAAT
ncbi:YhcH/YjgK/YiaL family protein [Bacillota bacterium Meth-B3]